MSGKSNEAGALRPIGLAFTAVVAGLGAAQAGGAAETTAQVAAPGDTADAPVEEILAPFSAALTTPLAEPDEAPIPDPFGI